MDYPIGLKYHVSLGIVCFKLVTTVLFTFKFQHFRSHLLLNSVATKRGCRPGRGDAARLDPR
jgi:hypothetical protein